MASRVVFAIKLNGTLVNQFVKIKSIANTLPRQLCAFQTIRSFSGIENYFVFTFIEHPRITNMKNKAKKHKEHLQSIKKTGRAKYENFKEKQYEKYEEIKEESVEFIKEHKPGFKAFCRKYGITAIGVYGSLFIVTFSSIYLLFHTGVVNINTVVSYLSQIEFLKGTKLLETIIANPTASQLTLSYLLCKMTEPIRLGLLFVITPPLAKHVEKLRNKKVNSDNKDGNKEKKKEEKNNDKK